MRKFGLVLTFVVAALLCSGTFALAQNYDEYLGATVRLLEKGDCVKAELNYNAYQKLTGKTSGLIERVISECKGITNSPSPMLTIGGYASGSSIPKSAIKSTPRFDAYLDYGTSVNCTVVSFKYVYECRGITTLKEVKGNTIPEEFLSDISKKPTGSVISFVDICVNTPSGQKKLGFTAVLE